MSKRRLHLAAAFLMALSWAAIVGQSPASALVPFTGFDADLE